MGSTYVALNTTSFSAYLSMLDVFNASGSTVIPKVYRCSQRTCYTSTDGGLGSYGALFTAMRVNTTKTSTPTGGSSTTPAKYKVTASNLPAEVTAGYGRTTVFDKTLCNYIWDLAAATISTIMLNTTQCLVPTGVVWSTPYGNSRNSPLYLRPTFGIEIKHAGPLAVSAAFFEIEFVI